MFLPARRAPKSSILSYRVSSAVRGALNFWGTLLGKKDTRLAEEIVIAWLEEVAKREGLVFIEWWVARQEAADLYDSDAYVKTFYVYKPKYIQDPSAVPKPGEGSEVDEWILNNPPPADLFAHMMDIGIEPASVQPGIYVFITDKYIYEGLYSSKDLAEALKEIADRLAPPANPLKGEGKD